MSLKLMQVYRGAAIRTPTAKDGTQRGVLSVMTADVAGLMHWASVRSPFLLTFFKVKSLDGVLALGLLEEAPNQSRQFLNAA
jgi:hypothetical protein